MKAPTFSLDAENLTIRWSHDCTATNSAGEPVGKTEHELPIGMTAWMVISNDPLTVTPEVNCERCGVAGSITNGKWVKS